MSLLINNLDSRAETVVQNVSGAGNGCLPVLSSAAVANPHRSWTKPNIDNRGRAARGGLALVFLLAGGCLISAALFLAVIFIVVGLFCAFEAWRGWCAIRACGFKLPF